MIRNNLVPIACFPFGQHHERKLLPGPIFEDTQSTHFQFSANQIRDSIKDWKSANHGLFQWTWRESAFLVLAERKAGFQDEIGSENNEKGLLQSPTELTAPFNNIITRLNQQPCFLLLSIILADLLGNRRSL